MRRASLQLTVVLLFSGLFVASVPAAPAFAQSCEQEMVRAAKRYDVPIGILYAVGLTETGRGDTLRPYALNIEGRSIYDIGKSEAIAAFQQARKRGKKLIDVGCMQINHHYHKRHFRGIGDMLTPSRNVDYAARFLRRLFKREGTWTMAAARYHAGPNNNAAQKRYVCRVISNMVAVDMGRWTPQAKSFCKG